MHCPGNWCNAAARPPVSDAQSLKGERGKGKGERGKEKGERGKEKGERGKEKGERGACGADDAAQAPNVDAIHYAVVPQAHACIHACCQPRKLLQPAAPFLTPAHVRNAAENPSCARRQPGLGPPPKITCWRLVPAPALRVPETHLRPVQRIE